MMPDELTVAIQAAIAWARERCRACRMTANYGNDPSFWPDPNTDHTCHGDLAAVRDVALAALETQPHLHEYEHVNSPCDPSAVIEVSSGCPRCCCEAQIERQFGLLGSERGKE